MINVGEKVDTRFEIKAFHQGRETMLTFSDLLSRPTIVSVYMRNNTPGCDRQNDSLVLSSAEFERAGFNVVAVSRDTCGSHSRYAAKKNIAYTLVSDPDDRFAKATQSLVEKSMYGRKFVGPARAVYVLDRDGTVLALAPKVDPLHHAGQVRELIAAIKPGARRARK